VALSPPPETIVPEAADTAGLVRRIQAGDRQAEEELVARYARGISVVLRRVVEDRSALEDLRQETFRLALVKIRDGELRDPARLSGFVCGVARNLAIEHLRRASRARADRPVDSIGEPAHPQATPLEALLERESARRVRQVLAELGTERDRQLLYRFYIAEEPKGSICADLGLDSLQFNRVLFRARARYRELYERWRGKR
jgi:RNA polymerase sigma-70 factor, ECF subfamily